MRPDRLYLEDILTAADAISTFVAELDAARFSADDMARSAVLFKLIVIGEAASKISAEVRDRYAEVPWRDIVGFRNFAVHSYFGVDWSIVWTTATVDVPPLRTHVAKILAETS